MQNLDKRMSALEQASPTDIGPIFIHFVGLDTKDREMNRTTKGDREWQRQPNETVQELKDRAIREAPQSKPRCSNGFHCF
jgi:hypothetical protein